MLRLSESLDFMQKLPSEMVFMVKGRAIAEKLGEKRYCEII